MSERKQFIEKVDRKISEIKSACAEVSNLIGDAILRALPEAAPLAALIIVVAVILRELYVYVS